MYKEWLHETRQRLRGMFLKKKNHV
jgi:hypothetical protein